MNIFVTGATGKVGSRFVPRLLQRGHHVKLLIRDAAKAEGLKQLGAEIVEGELLQSDHYVEALRGIDVVFHLAAQFRGVDENTTWISNFDGSIALAKAVLEAGGQGLFLPVLIMSTAPEVTRDPVRRMTS